MVEQKDAFSTHTTMLGSMRSCNVTCMTKLLGLKKKREDSEKNRTIMSIFVRVEFQSLGRKQELAKN